MYHTSKTAVASNQAENKFLTRTVKNGEHQKVKDEEKAKIDKSLVQSHEIILFESQSHIHHQIKNKTLSKIRKFENYQGLDVSH